MNSFTRIFLATLVVFLMGISWLPAQTISVVPNPSAPPLFTWTGSGALSGYAGNAITFNNTLVLEYNATGTSDQTQIILQLAVYNGGDTLHLIPNPDGGQGVYLQSVQVIYNNLLFFIYLDASGIQRLASFDGTAITLYPNPDAGLGYIGSPRIYNSNLYVAYSNAAGVTQFGEFTGSGINLIPNPDASTTAFYNDYSVVFDNKICSRYVAVDGTKHLATYDGTSWTIQPNPDATTRGFVPIFPLAYHNKLYIVYYGVAGQYQYMEYDGTNNPTLVPNPDDASAVQGGVVGLPIIFNDTLFYQYQDADGVFKLGKFDGTTMSLVGVPDATTYGYWNTPVVYNNNLYIFYLPADGTHHLTRYDAVTNNLDTIPNPDAGYGYWDQPIVYDNKLFFMYYNAGGNLQLGYYNGGNALHLVASPAGVYNGSAGNNGYTGYPVILNNLLYMQFGGVPYGDAGNLAYVDGTTLPVTLLDLTVQKAGTHSILQWKTEAELNNSYFCVQRSTDGRRFDSIGSVQGAGTASLQRGYSFTDDAPSTGVNFYRLKQVDIDGNFTYSAIVSDNFGISQQFAAYPNPAARSIYLVIPPNIAGSTVRISDAGGRTVQVRQLGSNAPSQFLDIQSLAAGIYHLTLVQGAVSSTVTVIKK